PSRRTAQRRGLLHLARSADHHRKLATPLQHDPTARIASLQTSSAGGLRASPHRVAGLATSTGSAGHAGLTTSSQLTFDLDHSMKAAPLVTLAARSRQPAEQSEGDHRLSDSELISAVRRKGCHQAE